MATDPQDDKKGFPNTFIWFLIGAFFFALFIQSLVETKHAKVSFSYQLEHLVNLQLIQPEESKKTALNDNLVSFSGKFREKRTEEGKNRYKFLELQNENHILSQDLAYTQKEMADIKESVESAAISFLTLTSTPIPQGGYVVVSDTFRTQAGSDAIVIKSLPASSIPTFFDLKNLYSSLNPKQVQEIDRFGEKLSEFSRRFLSPLIGVGDQPMKEKLRSLDKEIISLYEGGFSPEDKIKSYGAIIQSYQTIIDRINESENGVRLSELRSVRSYLETRKEEERLAKSLQENRVKLNLAEQTMGSVIWFFNNRELSTRALKQQDPEKFSHWFQKAKEEWDSFEANKGGTFRAPDQPLNTVLEKTFKSEDPTPNYIGYLMPILPAIMVIGVLWYLFSRQMKGAGNSAMNFGKSPARLMTKEKNKITFKDVAGIDEAKEELVELVDFLKDPSKFTALGGHIPKGVLCVGPPGTGKTLIAKAVAGEADRPFFSISGSDFVEMFVGVGASRIRDMFEQAKKSAPCIVFIDEIDAVGRHRGAGIGGGHDEREQTLNQLLVEMDGFDTNEGVILVAATNRPDVLDKALLRPGRFDRRIMIDLPDIKGRFEILKVHAKKIKLDPSVDLMAIARSTPGCSGADLANLLNEAALLAARKARSAVTAKDVSEARDKVLYGKERRSLELDEREKEMTAFHESGHAIVGLNVEHADPIDKVTIVPRGFSLGATMFLPRKNRVSHWKKELVDQLAVLMGGRVAEEIFCKDISSGAKQDIDHATQLARSMVCQWGMSDALGPVAYDDRSSSSNSYLGISGHHEKMYSEETARAIDAEVRRILDEAHDRAMEIIQEKKSDVELMTKMLMEFETLDHQDVLDIHNGCFDFDKKAARLKKETDAFKSSKDSSGPPSKKPRTSKISPANGEPSPNPGT